MLKVGGGDHCGVSDAATLNVRDVHWSQSVLTRTLDWKESRNAVQHLKS